MKSSEETIAFLAHRIGHVYERPLMYERSVSGIDTLLHTYHELWAEIMETRYDLSNALQSVLREAGVDEPLIGFVDCCERELEEQDRVDQLVKLWRKVSDCLDVPIPHDRIKNELARDG